MLGGELVLQFSSTGLWHNTRALSGANDHPPWPAQDRPGRLDIGRVLEAHRRQPLGERPQRDLQLGASELGPETEMRAVAKHEGFLELAAIRVEAVGIREDGGIAIGGGDPE